MTQTTHEQNDMQKIEAYLVLEDARMGTLPRHFGARMMTVEHTVREFAMGHMEAGLIFAAID
jgi:hypothetical protein